MRPGLKISRGQAERSTIDGLNIQTLNLIRDKFPAWTVPFHVETIDCTNFARISHSKRVNANLHSISLLQVCEENLHVPAQSEAGRWLSYKFKNWKLLLYYKPRRFPRGHHHPLISPQSPPCLAPQIFQPRDPLDLNIPLSKCPLAFEKSNMEINSSAVPRLLTFVRTLRLARAKCPTMPFSLPTREGRRYTRFPAFIPAKRSVVRSREWTQPQTEARGALT